MSTQTTRTIHSPVRLRGLLAVACHICWDMPAGLKGSASKPLPGSGHITGGVQSLSDSTGVVSTRRRFFARSARVGGSVERRSEIAGSTGGLAFSSSNSP